MTAPRTQTLYTIILAIGVCNAHAQTGDELVNATGTSDPIERKEMFLESLTEVVHVANAAVWTKRQRVVALRQKKRLRPLAAAERRELLDLVSEYRMPAPMVVDDVLFDRLLKRVDVVPAPLVLAQAANESAWGTSRFAREGRNLFGIWCYGENCGITPSRRKPGARHQVRRFPTLGAGVRYHIHNLNSQGAYAELRELRAHARNKGQQPMADDLAGGLARYSERGSEYVREIRLIMRQNELDRYAVAW